ncbi:MAG: hypothetical protein JWP12_339 [Bacteroidetes bacterium]|nr:hypothetical protein [Bacteroidota bacterium]
MKQFFFFILLSNAALAQYAPAVGQPGTSAMGKDSSAFVAWATGSIIQRGYEDLSNTSLGFTTVGDSTSVIGIADGSIVSLGDGGSAIISFAHPVINGPSWDFAVFENSFNDTFLELAFVEASSDGIHFYRFPASSLTDTATQTGSFGPTDPTKINNFAGKYRGLYGIPFDLNELAGVAGLDVNNIHYIKIVDVVGSIQPQYASYDTAGRAVNDPWPTGFASGGFDLDAVGVIHQNATVGTNELTENNSFEMYPNPCSNSEMLSVYTNDGTRIKTISIYSMQGKNVVNTGNSAAAINVSALAKGMYLVEAITEKNEVIRKKLMIR